VFQENFLGGKGYRFLGMTNLPLSRADCLEIRQLELPENLRAFPDLYRDCFTCLQNLYLCIAPYIIDCITNENNYAPIQFPKYEKL
jgi:hypothetical protein